MRSARNIVNNVNTNISNSSVYSELNALLANSLLDNILDSGAEPGIASPTVYVPTIEPNTAFVAIMPNGTYRPFIPSPIEYHVLEDDDRSTFTVDPDGPPPDNDDRPHIVIRNVRS